MTKDRSKNRNHSKSDCTSNFGERGSCQKDSQQESCGQVQATPSPHSDLRMPSKSPNCAHLAATGDELHARSRRSTHYRDRNKSEQEAKTQFCINFLVTVSVQSKSDKSREGDSHCKQKNKNKSDRDPTVNRPRANSPPHTRPGTTRPSTLRRIHTPLSISLRQGAVTFVRCLSCALRGRCQLTGIS